jgi:starch-binding outer membrane protein, SusD/RagB family
MKNKLLISIVAIFLILFNSCQEDVLDKQPLDIITDALVWNDQSLIDAYLTQTYANTYVFTQECSDNAAFGRSDMWFGMFDVLHLSDEVKQSWGPAVAGKNGTIRINGGTLEWWETSYTVIRSLNEFIQRVPDGPVDDVFKKEKTAEARWIRAFNYFSMVKRYGGVPIIIEPQSVDDPEETLYPERNTEKEVYDFVMSEMDAIVNDLPDGASAEPGRASKGAALALKSRAALYAGSIAQYGTVQLNGLLGINSGEAKAYYQKSYEASKALIDGEKYALYNSDPDKVVNYQNIFLKKDHSEVIFAKKHTYTDKQAGGNGWAWDFFVGPSPQGWGGGTCITPYLEMVEEYEYIDGTPGTLDRGALQQGLWTTDELWANREPRFYASICTQNTKWKGVPLQFYFGLRKPDGSVILDGSYEGVAARGNQHTTTRLRTGTGFGVLKYLEESKDNFGPRATSGTDYLVFRYGEILLNFAEAAFELGKTNEALDAINQIRRRAGVAELTSVDRIAIRHERKIELAFEGHRYWDLRRWRTAVNDLTRSFSGIDYILDYTTRKYQIKVLPNIDGITTQPVFHEYNYYLPITLKRTGNNTNLVENPGYN